VPRSNDLARYDALSDWLYTASQHRLYQACSAAGITPTQFFALSAIEQLGEPKMSALALHLGLTPGGATTLLNRLVDHGQVDRVADPQDRRCVYIRIAPAGRTALQTVQDRRQEQARQTFVRMPALAREHLLNGITALKDAWQTEETPHP
jgi:DNA-binding MarR family transcriptional regulator